MLPAEKSCQSAIRPCGVLPIPSRPTIWAKYGIGDDVQGGWKGHVAERRLEISGADCGLVFPSPEIEAAGARTAVIVALLNFV
jgi:hypothetical protein